MMHDQQIIWFVSRRWTRTTMDSFPSKSLPRFTAPWVQNRQKKWVFRKSIFHCFFRSKELWIGLIRMETGDLTLRSFKSSSNLQNLDEETVHINELWIFCLYLHLYHYYTSYPNFIFLKSYKRLRAPISIYLSVTNVSGK